MIAQIAVRNVFRHKARSIITLSTIVFGCVAIIFVGGFFTDSLKRMRESYIHAHTGHLQIYKKGFNQNGRIEPYGYLIADYKKIENLIRELPEVDLVDSRIQFAGLISNGENSVSFVGQGVEPDQEVNTAEMDAEKMRKFRMFYRPVLLLNGKGITVGDSNHVIMGIGLAENLGIKSGAKVTVLTNTVNGSTNAMDVMVNGVFRTSAKNFDDLYLRIPLLTAQKLLSTDSVQLISVMLKKTDDTIAVKRKLQKIIDDQKLDLEILTWVELADFYNKTVDLFNMFHFIMRLVTMIVVVLGIFNTMNMAMMERISEIGTIMALGTRRNAVMLLFLCEGLVMGVVGGALGLVAGCLFIKLVNINGIPMPAPPGGTSGWQAYPDIVPNVLCTAFILAVVMGVVSSLFPAYRASRLVIVEALRYR